mmetsp:Transcript_34388/g.46485  ORF Transcript_34388/g.46485 Transcript_34388/m.46485 type:complete len:93 (-) Transcript_34388:910-1188(-)
MTKNQCWLFIHSHSEHKTSSSSSCASRVRVRIVVVYRIFLLAKKTDPHKHARERDNARGGECEWLLMIIDERASIASFLVGGASLLKGDQAF